MAKEKVEETQEERDISKIQAVKELIFGPDIQTFEDQFKALNERLDDLQNQLIDESNERESSVHDLEKKTDNNLSKLEDQVQKELDRLKDKKTDRAVLGKLLIQIGEKLQS
ncbi:MAG: hypothetical protein HRT58_20775 [Crocinitomicaceae bacterium]|nr:hypothetical protein [Flavobacteriales bacterium]NQZ38107.1 hypothetical protein [Crocinitomicaceae bacterium]PHR26225.1 MAG: hypothetical protein COA38_15325 [Fluviicola sp.]